MRQVSERLFLFVFVWYNIRKPEVRSCDRGIRSGVPLHCVITGSAGYDISKGVFTMNMYEIILKSKHGEKLSDEEIKWLVKGYLTTRSQPGSWQ